MKLLPDIDLLSKNELSTLLRDIKIYKKLLRLSKKRAKKWFAVRKYGDIDMQIQHF